MKYKKYLLSFLILIISVVTFSGCANIEFVRKFDGSSEIFDRLVIELDKDELESFGYDLKDTMTIINEDLNDIRLYVEDWKKSFFEVEGLENVAKMVSTGIKVSIDKPTTNRIYMTVVFSDIKMFGLFYGYTTIEEYEYNKAMTDVGPFIDKIISNDYSTEKYGIFLYKSAIVKNGGILDSLQDFEVNGVNYYNKYRKEFNYDYNLEDVEFYEMFTYPDDRLYSNADDSEVNKGLSIYRWSLSDKDDNFEMILYKLSPNASAWYILALVVSILVVVVLSVIVIVNRINKKNLKKQVNVINE